MTIADHPPFWQQQGLLRPQQQNIDELLPIERGFIPETPAYSSGQERAYIIEDSNDLAAARRAVADRYLHEGYVKPEEIDEDGFIRSEVDPHVDDSVYFGFGRNGAMAATARLIHKPSLDEFPAIKEFDIDTKKLEVLSLDPSKFSEISALAKIRGVGNKKDILHVYAKMMRHSLENGQRYWLMSADSRLVGRLHQLFRADSFTELGSAREYMGSMTVPMAMDIHKSLGLYNKLLLPSYIKRIFTENLQGMDVSHLGIKEQKILKKHGVISELTGVKDTPLLTPERIGMAGLVAYAFARAVPVGALDDYGVNQYAFLGLDLATIPPYVMGTSRLIRAKDAKSSLIGGAVASAAFMAPYGYLAIEGRDMPPLPAAVVASYMGVAGILAYRRTKRQMQTTQDTQIESA